MGLVRVREGGVDRDGLVRTIQQPTDTTMYHHYYHRAAA
jgi:hypothetical protein